MAKPLDAFSDPARRPRAILMLGVVVLALAAMVIVALGVTSTRWFCANACHQVQDDTITSYNRSVHSEVSCMACHANVDGNPVTFVLHKAEALGELYLTVTKNYELPLNGHSEVALEMSAEQCTQCHSDKRRITPSEGIIIDHKAHADKGIACTMCHNRVAHVEDFDLELKDPKTGEPNKKHDDFMSMDACFRCHSQEKDAKAPGECAACHPKDFELKPVSHRMPGFYQRGGESGGHAELANADLKRVAAAAKKAPKPEGAVAEAAGEEPFEHVKPVGEISNCGTCHNKKDFCSGCHGVEMPHPANFQKGHGGLGKKNAKVCANCHAKGDAAKRGSGTEFCNGCHHKGADPTKPWIPQHFKVVYDKGSSACLECHNSTYCAKCHVRGIAK